MVSRPDLQVEFVNVNRTEGESIIFVGKAHLWFTLMLKWKLFIMMWMNI